MPATKYNTRVSAATAELRLNISAAIQLIPVIFIIGIFIEKQDDWKDFVILTKKISA